MAKIKMIEIRYPQGGGRLLGRVLLTLLMLSNVPAHADNQGVVDDSAQGKHASQRVADMRGANPVAPVPSAQASASPNGLTVAVPNGYATLSLVDLRLQSMAGELRWTRVWDGQEWKFNPHWESLSQSWKNLTGSQSADTTGGTMSGASPGELGSSGAGGGGCWVWVDEDWAPSVGSTEIGGIPQHGPMMPARTLPFNRVMGEDSADYPPPQRVSVDYASLCAGVGMSGSPLRDAEGIRRINELYLGDEGRYAFSNRSILEKRSVRQLAPFAAAALDADLADGRFDVTPVENPKGYRWLDKSGDWIDYNTQGQIVAYGDRNDNIVWFARDTSGRVRGVVAPDGRVLLSLHYNGELLASIKDYPQCLAQELPSRSVSYEYDANNRLVRVVDARGNASRYEYDAANRIVKIIDAEEREEALAYNGDAVSRRTSPDGAVTDYLFEYDDVNKQFTSRITGPETAAGRRVETYTHNRTGKLVRYAVNGRTEEEVRYDTGARVDIATNARGFTTRTTRDEFDQITEITYPDGSVSKYSYSALNLQLLEEIDEAGVKTRYELDTRGNRIKVVEAFGSSVERTVEYSRNGQGLITRITRKGRVEADQSVSPDVVWQIEYDELGQLRRTTDPEGHVRHYVYDRAGHLLQYTDARGNTTRYEVDALGNLLRLTDAIGRTSSYSYDKVGNLVSMTDPSNAVTRAEYDGMNRKTRITNPLEGVFNVQYNGQGLSVLESDEDGRSNQIEYDNFLRITRQIDALGNVTRFGYELADGSPGGTVGSLAEPVEVIYPTYTQQTRFDARERPSAQTVFNVTAQGTETLTSTVSHDRKGRVVSETDAKGHVRTHRYDLFGQLVESVDALEGRTSSLYDVHGNRLQFVDAKGNRYGFEYDRNRRVVRQTMPMGQAILSTYDPNGNLIETNGPSGRRVAYIYDAVNRLVEARYYQNGNTLVRSRTQTWDENDNLIAWTDTDLSRPTGQSLSGTASYDAANRKIAESVSYPDPRGGSFTLSYGQTFSLAGKKTGLVWADGTAITYGYSAHGELLSVSIPGEGTISVDRFKWSMPEKLDFPGGGSQTRSYDGLLNLEALTVKDPSQNTVFNLSNQFGRILELENTTRIDTHDGQSMSRSYAYGYDLENRLIQVQTSTGTLGSTEDTFTLDAVGNRISLSSQAGPWSYDANNRLIKRGTGACGETGSVCYDYDDAGNLTRKTDGTRITRYVFDSSNRLVEVLDGASNPIARYGYDSLDRRAWKEQYRNARGDLLATARRSYYLYADEGLIAEATQDIQIQADGSVVAGSAPVITLQYGIKPDSEFSTGVLFVKHRADTGGDTYAYYVNDQLNKPVQAVDRSGNVVWSAHYDAFGKAAVTVQSLVSNLRLPGQYADEETGLHYNLRRYYDPDTGRYLSQDPLGIDGGSNLYLYAMADPVNVTDARGEVPAIIMVPVAFCARFPRICASVYLCLRNPDKCRKGFCRVIHSVYKPACNVPGCKPSDGPGTTQFKAAAAEACVVGRTVARVVCFGSDKSKSGDNHENEIKKAQNKFQDCMNQMNQCRLK